MTPLRLQQLSTGRSEQVSSGERQGTLEKPTHVAGAPSADVRRLSVASLKTNALLRDAVILTLLFFAAWMPRALALDAFVTPDEPKWLSRSANFFYAMSDGDWSGTFQREHPGVTITWLGMWGIERWLPHYSHLAPGHMIDVDFERWLHENTEFRPLDLLVSGRTRVVLAVALLIALAYVPLRTLFGGRLAFFATLALAWDPFFLALSRQLHPDGLLAAFTALALLTWIAWLYRGRSSAYFVASAVLTGLALLTKTSAIFLLPTAGLLVLLTLLATLFRTRRVDWTLAGAGLFWLVLVALVYVALWPAMWVEPLSVLQRITVQMEKYQAVGHNLPSFFLGEVVQEPGALYYPLSILFRATPFALFGVLLAALWLLVPRLRRSAAAAQGWTAVAALVGFILIFVLGTTLVAKKFDRYILPAFLALDVVAVVGWAGLLGWIRPGWSRVRGIRPASWAAGALLGILLLHGLPGFVHAPYYLSYYNPLVGGTRVAPNLLMVGWGEGLDEAALWVREQAGDDQARVATWYPDGPTSYFLRADDKMYSYYPSPEFWFEADYAILYVNQWQRLNPSKDLMDYFFSLEPAYVVQKRGLELARVYDLRTMAPPDFTHVHADAPATFAERLRLAAYELPVEAAYPGDTLEVRLFLKRVAPVEENYTVELRLLGQNGEVLWQDQRWPAGIPTSSWPHDSIQHDVYQVPIPPELDPGVYPLSLAVLDEQGARALPITEGGERTAADGGYRVTSVQVQSPDAVAIDAAWPGLRFPTVRHQPTLQPGQTLVVELDAEGETQGQWKISLRLADGAGKAVAQLDKVVEPDLRFDLSLPDELSPGEYALVAVIYDPVTLTPAADESGAFDTTLSTVTVGP